MRRSESSPARSSRRSFFFAGAAMAAASASTESSGTQGSSSDARTSASRFKRPPRTLFAIALGVNGPVAESPLFTHHLLIAHEATRYALRMRYVARTPTAALAPFVETLWWCDGELPPARERILPTGCM